MANFIEIKTGGWEEEALLDEDQISLFQDNMLKTPNFSEGCEFTPTAPIKILGTEGLEVDVQHVNYTLLVDGTNSYMSGRTVHLIRKIGSWPDGTVTHPIGLGNVIIATVGAASVVLDLLTTLAVDGDWVRISMADTGTLTVHNNGTTTGVELSIGDQKTFVFDGTNWRLG